MVFLCSTLRVLKSGPEIPAVFSLLWGSSGTSKKIIGRNKEKSRADVDEASVKGGLDGNGKRCVRDRDEKRDVHLSVCVGQDIISCVPPFAQTLGLGLTTYEHSSHVYPKQFISVFSAALLKEVASIIVTELGLPKLDNRQQQHLIETLSLHFTCLKYCQQASLSSVVTHQSS
jgi:hypothetical protein